MALESRVFSDPKFQSWAKANVVRFAAVMTKIEGRKEDDLLRTYGFRGFPSLALLDADGKAITKSISRDLSSMKTTTAAAKGYLALAPKVEAGEQVDSGDWFMARLGLGKLDVEQARKEFASADLDAAERAQADQQLLALELTALLRSASGAKTEAAADQVLEWYHKGRRLPEGSSLQDAYSMMLLEGAKKAGDAEAFRAARPAVRESLTKRMKSLESLRPRYKDNPGRLKRLEAAIDNVKKQLDELEDAAKKFAKAG